MPTPLCRFLFLCCFAWAATAVRADFTFVHITDTHVAASNAPGSRAALNRALYREISQLSPKPAFVVTTGDVCEIGTDAEYAAYRKSLDDLSVPHYDAPGNHDVRWNPRGKEGFVRGARQPLYQSWNHENVHFVLLDSTVLLQHWGHFDQAMLDWLRADLEKVGVNRPVVIGFHHWVGRETVQVDNEKALLDLLAPYNVRLFLIGHGHADIRWSVRGIPAIMAKGLYQGSYHLVEVSSSRLRVLRRTTEVPFATTEVLSVPLARPGSPGFTATVRVRNDRGEVFVPPGDLPPASALTFRINQNPYVPMTASSDGWAGEFSTRGFAPGEHSVTVQATLKDGRAFPLPVALVLAGAGTPVPAWTADVGGAVQSRLLRGGDTLFVTTMGGDLVALDAARGKERWRVHTGGSVFSTPHIDNNTVYFGSADHHVYAVEVGSGRVKWKTKTGGAVFGGAASAQNVVCIASTDTKIYGLHADTGKVVWTAQGQGIFQSKAATDGERFFVGGWDNFFRALDVRTGKERWRQRFGKAFYFAPAIGAPTVGDNKVFVTSNDGHLHAMETTTGRIVWEVAGPALGYSGPLYKDGRIYNASLTGKGLVFCFEAATGAKLWETPTGSVIYDSSCAWGGGKVFVGSVDGTFSALRAGDGKLAWQYRLGPGHLLASPATDAVRVYIASMSGKVFALPLAP